jgi:hypothetical protein
MAEKRPSYVVPPTRKPSLFNSWGVVGFMAGSLTLNPFLPVVGAIAGSVFGKKRMETQLDNGKTVNPPSMLNKGAFIGATLCGLGPAVMGLATGGLGFIPAAVCAGIGGLIGAKINKSYQEKQYRQAENYVAQNGQFVPPRELAQQQIAMQQAQGMGQDTPQQGQAANMAQAAQQLNPQQLAQLQALAAQGQAMAPQQQEGAADRLAAQQRHTGPQQR